LIKDKIKKTPTGEEMIIRLSISILMSGKNSMLLYEGGLSFGRKRVEWNLLAGLGVCSKKKFSKSATLFLAIMIFDSQVRSRKRECSFLPINRRTRSSP